MNPFFLFSILTFPQYFKDNVLTVRVVIFPRLNPFKPLDGDGGVEKAFAEANFKFRALLFNNPDQFPITNPAVGTFTEHVFPAAFTLPANRGDLYNELKTYLQIVDDAPTQQFDGGGAPPKVAIKKYLTESYRSSFAFSRPRTPFCVTDDSFHCAIKNPKKPDPGFKQSPEDITWAKAFAWCLRNYHLSEKLGLILQADIPLNADFFKDGGWVHVDLANDSDYFNLPALPNARRLYAARIPALTVERSLFAPVVFPVQSVAPATGGYDEYFREAAAYDDGFTKIVHSAQPISQHLLNEKVEANHQPPLKDLGIRLGWDDEQIAIWLNRAVSGNTKFNGIDALYNAPQLGVFQYRIDTRLVDKLNQPLVAWTSLNQVEYIGETEKTLDNLMAGFTGELGVEVAPVQMNGEQKGEFWLPMFFSQWYGRSLVIPDEKAFELQVEENFKNHQPSRKYKPLGLENVPLQYGKRYEFRVRLSDMSGGGPDVTREPAYSAPAPTVVQGFRRYVIPRPVEILNLPKTNDPVNPQTVYQIQRPRLGYPALLFTEFGAAKAWELLLQDRAEVKAKNLEIGDTAMHINREYGWYDPDVATFEIQVEMKALAMDNFGSAVAQALQLKDGTEKRITSAEGKSNFILLYKTIRNFEAANLDVPESLGNPFDLNLEFRDIPTLAFGDGFDTWVKTTFATETPEGNLVLPTARDIRITLTPLGKADPDETYFGAKWAARGKSIQFNTRAASKVEQNLFTKDALPVNPADVWRCIYLQPDAYPTSNQQQQAVTKGTPAAASGDMVQLLANALRLEPKGMSLIAKKGRRALFAAAKEIRHTLAPDNSSITFSGKADLSNHWLSVLSLTLHRDWTWDALDINAFEIKRRKKFTRAADFADWETVGYIQTGNAINVQALEEPGPDRTYTELYFIDAVEPKPTAGNFPDTIELEYQVAPRFKADQKPTDQDEPLHLQNMTLPVTTNPTQIPKIISVGIALSPYVRDEVYASTESRQKMLWIEFEQPIENPDDIYFARVLAYAPDPVLFEVNLAPEPPQVHPSGIPLTIPKEPPLPIESEAIRTIVSDQAHDRNGLDAMQEMIPATVEEGKKARHYLLPLPPGLNADSRELLGFFVYELRVGHAKVWSTAQGRFGAALRVTGVQHPAPDLTCNPSLTRETLDVYAPFATPVLNGQTLNYMVRGREVPWFIKTTLWAVLYVQVKQADGKDYRNILLDQRRMNLHRSQEIIITNAAGQQTVLANWDPKDPLGHALWKRQEIKEQLHAYGIPLDAPLSVLAVEMMPTRPGGFEQPLSAELGRERILRTSPLVPVDAGCCVDC